jgi:hypothetical protein
MTTRTVFENFGSGQEQKLYTDLLNEFVQIMGKDMVYVPRTSESASGFDLLFGDDVTKKYSTNYTIECYVQSVDNFEGQELFSKFGLQVKKQARFLMPYRAFQREVAGAYSRPREGDLLWVPTFKALFEIKKVDEEYMFYSLNNTDFYAFSLIVEKFRYNDEKVITDVPEINDVVNSQAFAYQFVLAPGGSGTYQLGEAVSQNTGASALVVSWNLPSQSLVLKQIQGLFLPNTNIIGASSGANWRLLSYNQIQSVNDGYGSNQVIETAANSVLNFSETDPLEGAPF